VSDIGLVILSVMLAVAGLTTAVAFADFIQVPIALLFRIGRRGAGVVALSTLS